MRKLKIYVVVVAFLLHGISDASSASNTASTLVLENATPFSYDALIARAKDASKKPYEPPSIPTPDISSRIDYDEWGKIRFDVEYALKMGGPAGYPVTMFHLGKYFPRTVKIHVVEGQVSRLVRYTRDCFEMPSESPATFMPENAGFAGFRLQEAEKRPDWRTQDWMVFLGASYFRAIGSMNQYGLSARGIAIDTGGNAAEEFPDFTDFFIEQANGEHAVTVYAYMDGPSVVGAFRFVIMRTNGVIQDVTATIIARKHIMRLGLAPLTSMFWFNESDRSEYEDWRPEVHDSDGIAIWMKSGEWRWRPLTNPRKIERTIVAPGSVKGFGLLQRERSFEQYLDGVHYERRPSLWVEPIGDWGSGSVELVELPTDDEIHDNVVAYWRPNDAVEAGASYQIHYRLYWGATVPFAETVAQCVSTRIGRGGQSGKPRPEGVYKFVVEFQGPTLDPLWGDTVNAFPIVTSSEGKIEDAFIEPVPGTERWRAIFDFRPQPTLPADIELHIQGDGAPLTESWNYHFVPSSLSLALPLCESPRAEGSVVFSATELCSNPGVSLGATFQALIPLRTHWHYTAVHKRKDIGKYYSGEQPEGD